MQDRKYLYDFLRNSKRNQIRKISQSALPNVSVHNGEQLRIARDSISRCQQIFNKPLGERLTLVFVPLLCFNYVLLCAGSKKYFAWHQRFIKRSNEPVPDNAEEAVSLAESGCLAFPEQITVRSIARSGRQYFFKQPLGVLWKNTNSVLAKYVDIKVDGGYVIALPSVLEGQRRYRWAPTMELDVGPEQLPLPPA